MKPRNFPARKLARKLAAEIRAMGSRAIRCTSPAVRHAEEIERARAIRTKKDRSSRC